MANLATNPPPTFTTGGRWPQAAEHVVSERLLQPDPNDFIRIVIAGVSPTGGMSDPQAGICFGVIQGTGVGSTCRRLSQAFVRGPLWLTIGGSGMSQYSVLSGIASDDVARIAAYLGNGDVVPVALRDNTFVARIGRASFPLRVVAFDGDGRVVEVQDFASDGMTSPAPGRCWNLASAVVAWPCRSRRRALKSTALMRQKQWWPDCAPSPAQNRLQ